MQAFHHLDQADTFDVDDLVSEVSADLISSRKPDDLKAFCASLVERFAA